MAGSLVIAAIPDENDRVWKVSSEKVPHLTLLYLGEDADQVQNVDQIMLFVEHAANTTLRRFYLPVDRRGELGDDKADVLFFKKGRYDYKAIRDFRAQLLQNTSIKTAYDSAKQFEGPWNPHLTLGYPDTPAKPDENDFPFYDVSFNKVAVWTGDYEGPEFLLKDYFDEYEALETVPMDVAMSNIQHYGVKGMKWGVRRYGRTAVRTGVGAGLAVSGHPFVGAFVIGSAPTAEQRREKAGPRPDPGDRLPTLKELPGLSKAGLAKFGRGASRAANALGDHFWETSTYSDDRHAAVHNNAAERVDSNLRKLQDSPKYAGKNLKTDKKLKDAYDEDVAKVTEVAYKSAVKDVYGDNVSGTKTARYVDDARGPRIEIREKATGRRTREAPLTSSEEIQRRKNDQDLNKVLKQDGLQHAEVEAPDISIPVQTDGKGIITGLGFVVVLDNEMAQTAELGAEFLAHYGVKGMRWGVRNADRPMPTAVPVSARSVVPSGTKRKTKIETEGGENHDASPDAIKVAQAKTKLQKSGTAALSNAELREVANRLQLEQQVKQLTQPKTQRFVSNLLKTQGNQAVNQLVGQQVRRGLRPRAA